ncbi:MAG: hypothetical protein A3F83_08640 [Candidatus Glassbacteria bacterium RIFCSPLOWO2_12_FULL_58_11]|uniref:YggT family protein n=2 Tax=Candidatus Glassiibacteriota TaxID=1817805 RepID=A0A1F5YPF8_9BACT|nr:MAG: hypothetical protein A2Z86_11610 [Candidatus Glassbacteria bacterium GWA2_58_10]OGG01964.1 MAG: hypothetical protein A3F83_08640 [Candidatus Glassbacteria bacterium RIFCSPLOWO2_12_FULL_58_11]
MLMVNFVNGALTLYGYLLLARILISWVGVNYSNPWIRLLCRLTDPFLEPFRALIPPLSGIDFSPLVAFFVLNMLRSVLVRFLLHF